MKKEISYISSVNPKENNNNNNNNNTLSKNILYFTNTEKNQKYEDNLLKNTNILNNIKSIPDLTTILPKYIKEEHEQSDNCYDYHHKINQFSKDEKKNIIPKSNFTINCDNLYFLCPNCFIKNEKNTKQKQRQNQKINRVIKNTISSKSFKTINPDKKQYSKKLIDSNKTYCLSANFLGNHNLSKREKNDKMDENETYNNIPMNKESKIIKTNKMKKKRGRFNQKKGLLLHLKTYHLNFYFKDNIYFCPMQQTCGFKFETFENLFNHMYINHYELFGLKMVPILKDDDNSDDINLEEEQKEDFYMYKNIQRDDKSIYCVLPEIYNFKIEEPISKISQNKSDNNNNNS